MISAKAGPIAALAALAVAIPLAAQAAAPNWALTFTVSDMGGHIMGNPAAPKKLVEYVSYTCGHCAEFQVASNAPLKAGLVKQGKVSVEVRNLLRDPLDVTAALLARCGGKGRFFGNHHALMTSQDQWMGRAKAAPRATQESWFTGTIPQRAKRIASGTGMYAIMAKRGVTKAQADQCLADPAALKAIEGMTEYATGKLKINATPSFTLNGKLLDAHDWPGVQAALAKP